MEELKEALKTKTKKDNHLEKIILILSFTNMQKTHFIRDYWFLNNICIMGEM